MHQLTLPLFNALPQYCTQVGYSNPTGSQIFFIYQNTSYFRLDVNGTFLTKFQPECFNPFVLLCGFLLYSADG